MSTTVGIARFRENDEHEKTSFSTDQTARQYLQRYFTELNGPDLANFDTRCEKLAHAKGLTYRGLDVKQKRDFHGIVPEDAGDLTWFITIEAE